MEYKECQYYQGRMDAVGYCGLNESLCLVDAFKEKCDELKKAEEDNV